MPNESIPKFVRPVLRMLRDSQIERLHQYSLDILSKTGILVESKKARKIFKKSDGVRIDGDTIFISKDLVNHAISTSPSNIEVFDRKGNIYFNLGSEQSGDTYFGIGVTNPYFQEIQSGKPIPFTRKHMQNCTSLGDLLDNYSMISTPGIPSGIDSRGSDMYSTLDMYANTNKPLVLLVSDEEQFAGVLELLTFLHGDISSHPFCLPYVNPITPLVLNRSTSNKMITSIQAGLPVMYSNYGMYGSSTPSSEGGTLALLNAELLAGLVFSQLVKEGAEIILGSLPAAFNMKTMGSRFTTSTYLMNIACAEMMDYYRIPHCGTSGSNNAWGPDLLAAGDLWMNHLSSVIGKIGCAPFVGGNFDSLAFSPSTLVLSDHIIGEAKKFARGFVLDDETVNINEIDKVGPRGSYLTSNQTLESLPELKSGASIWPSLSLQEWTESGSPKAESYLLEYSDNLYNQAIENSEDNFDVIEKGEMFIQKTLSE